MELFNRQYTHDYTNLKKEQLKSEINKISDEDILRINIDEFKEYFYKKYFIDDIEIVTESINSNLEKTKIEEYNPFYSTLDRHFGEKTYKIDGYKINYEIPFKGNSDLLFLKPSMSILSSFPIDNINNTPNYLSYLIFSIKIKASKLEQNENPQEIIDNKFDTEFKNYKTMIGYVNNDIHTYNNSLQNIISDNLEIRKRKSGSFTNLMSKLNIPLKNNNSTNLTPSNLKIDEKEIKCPKPKEDDFKEYSIKDSDYENIINIIKQACIQFERTARTFNKLEEEELRDFLLANLNTHYNSLATGETFSKNGKTDIRIQFENKAAYVAECKIWHGISEFENAIKQLFSYITWRDVKTSLIVFNKNNKDFKSIISKVKSYLENNELCINIKELENNNWQCTFKKDTESSEIIELNILLCDIYI